MKECKREAPPKGWKKLNFEGASRGNPGKDGIGCIVKLENGDWIIKRAKHMGIIMNNIVELEALREGLKLTLNNNITKLIIEGDSQIILNAIRKHQTPNWVMNAKLESVLCLIDQFEEIQIQHIFCEGNVEADKLAIEGVEGEYFTLISSSYLSEII